MRETGRLTAVESFVPWYRRAPAYIAYGVVLGAVLMFSAETFIARRTGYATQTLAVTSPGTIGSAIAKARPGDTLMVGPGVYTETVRLKEGVTLIARRLHEAVIRGIDRRRRSSNMPASKGSRFVEARSGCASTIVM